MKTRGVSYSTSPQLESRRGSQLGVIQLGELLEAGVKVSLSTDHIASVSCDPFSSMRILFALHSHRIGARVPLTLKRLLQLATLDGAVDLGIADRTGSITPGKRADLVLVRTTDLNMAPVTDPYEAVVSFGLPANVDTVLIDGRILRRAGKFTAFDDARSSLRRARQRSDCARRPAGRPECAAHTSRVPAVEHQTAAGLRHRSPLGGAANRRAVIRTCAAHRIRA